MKNIYKNLYYMNFLWNSKRVYWKLIKGYVKTNFLKKDQIRFVEIMPSYACNARCEICSCKALKTKGGKMLTPEKIYSVIDQCAELDVPVISFLGGEPLLIKELFDYISYVARKGILAGISTNAGLLTEEKLEELKKAGLGFMSVSVLSPDPEIHNSIFKIPDSFRHSMEIVKMARDMKIAVNIATVFTRPMMENGSYKKMVDLAKNMKVRLNINNFIPALIEHLSSGDVLAFENNKEIERLCKDNVFISTHMTNNYFGYGCPIGNCYLGITPFGDALPCFFTPISFGNVWNDSLKSVFEKMLKVPFFKARPKMCLAGENKEFINEYLAPVLKDLEKSPLEVEKHPKFNPKTGTLKDIKNISRHREVNI